MAMTDPIADLLTRIRNAMRAGHDSVEVPSSHMKESLIKVLIAEGYLQDVKKVKAKEGFGELLKIQIRFDKQRRPVITGLRRISRPGRRVYVGVDEIAPIRRGLGVNVLSTPKGLLVDREAKKAKVGGELICSVW
jgi:small subunit ribosomal protein S8